MSHAKYILAGLTTWYMIAVGNCAGAVTGAFFTGVFVAMAAYEAEFRKLTEQRDTAWRYMDELKNGKTDEAGH